MESNCSSLRPWWQSDSPLHTCRKGLRLRGSRGEVVFRCTSAFHPLVIARKQRQNALPYSAAGTVRKGAMDSGHDIHPRHDVIDKMGTEPGTGTVDDRESERRLILFASE